MKPPIINSLQACRSLNIIDLVTLEAEREKLLEHVRWASAGEVVVIGGDFNAHVGGGVRRGGVCGRFGLRASFMGPARGPFGMGAPSLCGTHREVHC